MNESASCVFCEPCSKCAVVAVFVMVVVVIAVIVLSLSFFLSVWETEFIAVAVITCSGSGLLHGSQKTHDTDSFIIYS